MGSKCPLTKKNMTSELLFQTYRGLSKASALEASRLLKHTFSQLTQQNRQVASSRSGFYHILNLNFSTGQKLIRLKASDPHLWEGDNAGTFLTGLLWRLSVIMYINYLINAELIDVTPWIIQRSTMWRNLESTISFYLGWSPLAFWMNLVAWLYVSFLSGEFSRYAMYEITMSLSVSSARPNSTPSTINLSIFLSIMTTCVQILGLYRSKGSSQTLCVEVGWGTPGPVSVTTGSP